MSILQLVEQLKSYYTSWKANVNVKTSLSMTQDERGPVRAALVHSSRAADAPPLKHQTLQRHVVQQGFIQPGPGDAAAQAACAPLPADQALGAQEPAPTAVSNIQAGGTDEDSVGTYSIACF
jgi:hypothetical protein